MTRSYDGSVSLGSRLLARLAGLPARHTSQVMVDRDLRVPMPDGVELLADRYFPEDTDRPPIILVRSPYGRSHLMGAVGRIFAERGYQAVVQSTRGTFGSGGTFDPFRHEARDGKTTLAWLAAQPWFGGSVGMFGPSYLGFVQWAAAADGPGFLKALVPCIGPSEFRTAIYGGEAFSFDTTLTWMDFLAHQEAPGVRVLGALITQRRRLARAFAHLPMNEADRFATGHRIAFYQDWLAHAEPGDAYWQAVDHRGAISAATAPVHIVAGWYDLFLPQQIADYMALAKAGVPCRLTVGPWTHVSPDGARTMVKEALAWFDLYLRSEPAGTTGRPGPPSPPVRVYLMGAKRWIDLDEWPPPSSAVRWHLQPAGGLARSLPPESSPDEFTYDPTDPTPSVGGIVMGPHAGPRDNRKLELRADVLTYTSEPLDSDLDVIGPVAAELHVRPGLSHTDFFARVTDVEPGGRSINVCDGLVRLWPGRFPTQGDGSLQVTIDLWPTAYSFRQGHRVRLQVSSGAHPRYSRNPGTGEPLGTAVSFQSAHQTIFHDAAHPSALRLPEWASTGSPARDLAVAARS